jgi:hypothetical protein
LQPPSAKSEKVQTCASQKKATKGIESLCAHQKGGLLSDSLPSRSKGNRCGGPQSHTPGHNRETIRVKSQYQQIKLRWINWNRNFPLQRDAWRESAAPRRVQQLLLALRGLACSCVVHRNTATNYHEAFAATTVRNFFHRPASVSNSNSRVSASCPKRLPLYTVHIRNKLTVYSL